MDVISTGAIGILLTDDFVSRLTGSGVFESPSHYISMRTNLDGCRVSDSGALCSTLVRHRNQRLPIPVTYQVAKDRVYVRMGG
jgi:hypothetical protein